MCRNASLALCQCEKDEWKAIQKGGVWSSVMCPYEERYIDVKFVGGVAGSVSVAVEEGAAFFLLPLFIFLPCRKRVFFNGGNISLLFVQIFRDGVSFV